MKKVLLTVAIAALAIASSKAQGLVYFSSSTQNVSTNNGTIGKTSGANNYYYALFFSTTATTVGGSGAAVSGIGATQILNNASWTFSGDYGASTATVGRWAALNANSDTSSTVSGLPAGSSAQFVILGWNASLGTTLGALTNSIATQGTSGLLGQSAVSGAIGAGDGNQLPTGTVSGSGFPNVPGFTLGAFIVPTPEPATLALAGLSGASLLLFRRRK